MAPSQSDIPHVKSHVNLCFSYMHMCRLLILRWVFFEGILRGLSSFRYILTVVKEKVGVSAGARTHRAENRTSVSLERPVRWGVSLVCSGRWRASPWLANQWSPEVRMANGDTLSQHIVWHRFHSWYWILWQCGPTKSRKNVSAWWRIDRCWERSGYFWCRLLFWRHNISRKSRTYSVVCSRLGVHITIFQSRWD